MRPTTQPKRPSIIKQQDTVAKTPLAKPIVSDKAKPKTSELRPQT